MSVDRKRIQLLGCVSLAALGVALMPDSAFAQGAVCGTQNAIFGVLPPNQGDTGLNATNTACGPGASTATTTNAVAVGQNAEVTAIGGIAIGGDTNNGGVSATASGAGSIAIGSDNSTPAQGALASGTGAVAIGESSRATKNGTVAVGAQANAAAVNSIAIGGAGGVNSASATGASAIAIGQAADADGIESVALGVQANTKTGTTGGVAIGRIANSTANNATAIGQTVTASGTNSVALGANTSATGASAIAIGDGATAGTGANAIAIGTRCSGRPTPSSATAASREPTSGPREGSCLSRSDAATASDGAVQTTKV